jgi:hypothetical protein
MGGSPSEFNWHGAGRQEVAGASLKMSIDSAVELKKTIKLKHLLLLAWPGLRLQHTRSS